MKKSLVTILSLTCLSLINLSLVSANVDMSGVNSMVNNALKNAGVDKSITDLVQQQLDSANFLANKGFIKVSDDYRLSDNITRKEAMKMISNVAYLKVDNKCEGKFSDVADDWGCKYIEAALRAGFVKQTDKFRPDDFITKPEILKLIFKARNLDKKYNTKDWQQDYVASAFDLGLVDSIFTDFGIGANRGWIFNVVGNSFPEFTDNTKTDTTKIYTDEVKVK